MGLRLFLFCYAVYLALFGASPIKMTIPYPMKKILLSLLSILCVTAHLCGQMVEDPTRWSHQVGHVKDDVYELVTTCNFTNKEWHLWSMTPGGDGTLIAPELSYTFPDGASAVGKTTEHGKLIKEDIKGVGKVRYFKNKIVYKQKFKATKDGTVKGSVRYQTCNDETCLPPNTIDFSTSYKVKKEEPKEETKGEDKKEDVEEDEGDVALLNTGMDSSEVELDTTDADSSSTAAISEVGDDLDAPQPEEKKESNFMLFLKGILAGLFSIFTPCVFAMLPMVVSLFLKRSKNKKDGVKVATQYTLSIVGIFALFGLILTLFVSDGDALHRFATNWITNVVLFFVFLIFALSFLGAFEITLPSSWSTATEKKANTNNFVGVFFMALTLVIVSFSCTLPFIGGLASAISNGTGFAPFWGFLGFGVGLGLPFTLFVIFPSMLTAINKQGGWLNMVKVTLGFVELAMAFKFLSNADLVKGWRLLDREVFIGIWVVIALALAMYLFSFYKLPKDSQDSENFYGQKYISVPRLMFALIAFSFGVYLLPGMWGAPLKGMGAFLPPFGTFDAFGGVPTASVAGNGHEKSQKKYAEKLALYEPDAALKYKLNMVYDYEEALELSRKEGKPIMLDFTGIACANCRKMEAGVWSDPEVGKNLHDNFIIASLFTDAYNIELEEGDKYTNKDGEEVNNIGDKNVDIQITKYKSNTQPYYFFIDADENRLVEEGYGYSVSNDNPTKFNKLLNQAKAKYKSTHP